MIAQLAPTNSFLTKRLDSRKCVRRDKKTDYWLKWLELEAKWMNTATKMQFAGWLYLVKNGNDSWACEIYSSWRVTGNQARHPKHLGIAQPSTGAKLLTLDSYRDASKVNHIDLIKLDVDGFESAVIAGGLEVLQRDKPIVCLELAPYALLERGSSFAELLGLLQECGYKLVRLENRSPLSDRLGDLTMQSPMELVSMCWRFPILGRLQTARR